MILPQHQSNSEIESHIFRIISQVNKSVAIIKKT